MSEASVNAAIVVGGADRDPETRRIARRGRRRLTSLAFLLADLMAAQAASIVAVSMLQSAALVRSDVEVGVAATFAVLGPAAVLRVYEQTVAGILDRLKLRVWAAAAMPWIGLGMVAFMHPVSVASVQLLGVTAAVYVLFSMLVEACARWLLFCWLDWGARVLVVGSDALAGSVIEELRAVPQLGLRPVGYCGELTNDAALGQLPRLGSMDDVARLRGVADVALVALSGELPTIDPTRLPFERIVLVPSPEQLPAIRMRSCLLGWATALHYAGSGQAVSYQRIKRALDLLVAVPLLLFSLPLMAGVALAIWCISSGPVFYAQRRVGWQGRPLTIFKLRSMWPDAAVRLERLLQNDPLARQEWQRFVKLRSDPRVLPIIGNFIRKTSIDELPQLWNVIRGDLSLVGPRPFPAYHVERFSQEFQNLRNSVHPGLTGLWQVTARSSADIKRQEMIDTYYIRNQSLLLDLYIMLLTVPAVLNNRAGAR